MNNFQCNLCSVKNAAVAAADKLPPVMKGFKSVTDTVEVEFTDGAVGLAFYCHREKDKGWYSETGDRIEKKVTHWRPIGEQEE